MQQWQAPHLHSDKLATDDKRMGEPRNGRPGGQPWPRAHAAGSEFETLKLVRFPFGLSFPRPLSLASLDHASYMPLSLSLQVENPLGGLSCASLHSSLPGAIGRRDGLWLGELA